MRRLQDGLRCKLFQYQSIDSSPISGFIIFYRVDDSLDETFLHQRVEGSNKRRATLARLAPNLHYKVKIASYNEAGQGPYSNEVVEELRSSAVGKLP